MQFREEHLPSTLKALGSIPTIRRQTEMAQQVKEPAAKSDDLITGTHTVEGEKLLSCPLTFVQPPPSKHIHTLNT